jgi:hypothetical protein
MRKRNQGLAAASIDIGYAVKLPLSQALDAALGVPESHPCSLVQALNLWYELRRPSCVLMDNLLAAWLTCIGMAEPMTGEVIEIDFSRRRRAA